ncbi:hypothetical protein H2198_007819 [Neophaeococcomyces mojaviensis]|uniref:Uncharacterized protein n=1 Tax=Neophaeococcomyces mojaviensis TaxID=3383035 RepID=A0ACC2ZZL0_9EURO|nr:hypothetical protein H2198_007819 [Knufia sp. JES_112]
MPAMLLPASAQAFAQRGTVNVVLSNKVEPWLTATLKRINKIKRPLNSVPQHTRCLTETLSSPNAIWSLCSIMIPKAPEAELRQDSNPLVEAMFNYQMLQVEAYVVHVDMVSQNEVAFKLTQDTIDSLIEHHKEVFSIDTAAKTWNWPDKDTQLKKLQEDFVQAANKFVYRTSALALEGLEEDGAGELLCGRSDEVRQQISNLYVHLMPPPPKPVVEIIRPTPILPSSNISETWWPSQHISAVQPVEAWKIVPSSPSPVSSCDSNHGIWTGVGMPDINNLPSPTPSFHTPYSTAAYTTSGYYTSSPAWSAPTPVTTMAMSSLPLPSMLASQPCGTSAGMGGFGWDRYNEYSMQYATAM